MTFGRIGLLLSGHLGREENFHVNPSKGLVWGTYYDGINVDLRGASSRLYIIARVDCSSSYASDDALDFVDPWSFVQFSPLKKRYQARPTAQY